MKALTDTNIIMDVLTNRAPFSEKARQKEEYLSPPGLMMTTLSDYPSGI